MSKTMTLMEKTPIYSTWTIYRTTQWRPSYLCRKSSMGDRLGCRETPPLLEHRGIPAVVSVRAWFCSTKCKSSTQEATAVGIRLSDRFHVEYQVFRFGNDLRVVLATGPYVHVVSHLKMTDIMTTRHPVRLPAVFPKQLTNSS